MKINAIKFYTCLFIIVLFIQLYATSFRFIIFFEIFVLLLLAFLEKQKISLRFVKIIMPVIVIFLLGFLGMVSHKYHIFNIIKDIFHFIKPILGLLIGYIFYKRMETFCHFPKQKNKYSQKFSKKFRKYWLNTNIVVVGALVTVPAG